MTAKNDEQTPSNKIDEKITDDSIAKPPKHTLKHYLESFWYTLTKFIILILTVVTLILSILQLRQAIRTDQDSNGKAEQLSAQYQILTEQYRALQETQSTKYVDVFPDNMLEINKLLEDRVQQSLTVVVDIAAYAHFSSPSESGRYVEALTKLSRKGIKIKFICYDPKTAQSYLKKQFGWEELVKKNHGSEAEAWKRFTENNSEKVTAYKNMHQSDMPQSMDDLVNQITNAGDELLTMLKQRGAEIKETSNDLPIFMWVGDNSEAIFSLHTYGQDPREHSFKTSDHAFIERLNDIYAEAATAKAEASTQSQPCKQEE
jgi:hypothetical protein